MREKVLQATSSSEGGGPLVLVDKEYEERRAEYADFDELYTTIIFIHRNLFNIHHHQSHHNFFLPFHHVPLF